MLRGDMSVCAVASAVRSRNVCSSAVPIATRYPREPHSTRVRAWAMASVSERGTVSTTYAWPVAGSTCTVVPSSVVVSSGRTVVVTVTSPGAPAPSRTVSSVASTSACPPMIVRVAVPPPWTVAVPDDVASSVPADAVTTAVRRSQPQATGSVTAKSPSVTSPPAVSVALVGPSIVGRWSMGTTGPAASAVPSGVPSEKRAVTATVWLTPSVSPVTVQAVVPAAAVQVRGAPSPAGVTVTRNVATSPAAGADQLTWTCEWPAATTTSDGRARIDALTCAVTVAEASKAPRASAPVPQSSEYSTR